MSATRVPDSGLTGRVSGAAFAALLLAFGAHAAQPTIGNPTLAEEAESLNAVCGQCHPLQIVMDTPMTYDGWHETVQKMVDRGARGSDDQFDDIMDYLHRTMTTINVNHAETDELEIVLNVATPVAQAIAARRARRAFTDLKDLKSVQGVDKSLIDAKARMIFFR